MADSGVLVTGGLGYIGSHMVLALLEAGVPVVVLDNLGNSDLSVLDRLQRLARCDIPFHPCDIRDAAALHRVFRQQRFSAVLHFAGLKAVGESVEAPLLYYDNNVSGSLNLLRVMSEHGVRRLVFSSSATVYGDPETVPIVEDAALRPSNPYGRTKGFVEDILRDLVISDPDWRVAILRYFNPVGAHASGMIGEAPKGEPNNLMPYLVQVAAGRRPFLRIWGDDYPTPDGTGVRDYLHVEDLVSGHLAALRVLDHHPERILILNLGTGRGHSVREMVDAFERVTRQTVPCRISPRRPGDVPVSLADVTRARQVLGWSAQRGIDEMCRDAWRWEQSEFRSPP